MLHAMAPARKDNSIFRWPDDFTVVRVWRRQARSGCTAAFAARFARQEVARADEYERRRSTEPFVFVSRVTSVTPAAGGRRRRRRSGSFLLLGAIAPLREIIFSARCPRARKPTANGESAHYGQSQSITKRLARDQRNRARSRRVCQTMVPCSSFTTRVGSGASTISARGNEASRRIPIIALPGPIVPGG
jgi:hypothetical protein